MDNVKILILFIIVVVFALIFYSYVWLPYSKKLIDIKFYGLSKPSESALGTVISVTVSAKDCATENDFLKKLSETLTQECELRADHPIAIDVISHVRQCIREYDSFKVFVDANAGLQIDVCMTQLGYPQECSNESCV